VSAAGDGPLRPVPGAVVVEDDNVVEFDHVRSAMRSQTGPSGARRGVGTGGWWGKHGRNGHYRAARQSRNWALGGEGNRTFAVGVSAGVPRPGLGIGEPDPGGERPPRDHCVGASRCHSDDDFEFVNPHRGIHVPEQRATRRRARPSGQYDAGGQLPDRDLPAWLVSGSGRAVDHMPAGVWRQRAWRPAAGPGPGSEHWISGRGLADNRLGHGRVELDERVLHRQADPDQRPVGTSRLERPVHRSRRSRSLLRNSRSGGGEYLAGVQPVGREEPVRLQQLEFTRSQLADQCRLPGVVQPAADGDGARPDAVRLRPDQVFREERLRRQLSGRH
jgi:hypothetical protein